MHLSIYNVLEKLRSGHSLTAKDKAIHEHGLVSVLKQIHDDLDAAVFDAYGWPHDLTDEQILERLVALNAERAEEERNGLVRWLRPEFQNPQGDKTGQRAPVEAGRGGLSIGDVASAFKGARRADVESILESLSRLGLARSYRDDRATLWSAVRIA